MARKPKNDLPLMAEEDGIVLFYPHMPKKAKEYVCDTLDSRWIGQGPKVELFEARFRTQFNQAGPCISTGSGTDALHLAYLLAGIKAGEANHEGGGAGSDVAELEPAFAVGGGAARRTLKFDGRTLEVGLGGLVAHLAGNERRALREQERRSE